jgi:ribosomal protein L32
MKCHNCGGSYKRFKGPLRIKDPYIGPFEVDIPEYLKCENCGEYLLPGRWAEEIDRARARKLEESLAAMPLREFITASEAARLLGISRQALHKNRRIRNGFIFHTRFGDIIVYLKKSVELFKEMGDGRYPLWKSLGQASNKAEFTAEREVPSDEFLRALFDSKPTDAFIPNEYSPGKIVGDKKQGKGVFMYYHEMIKKTEEVYAR